MSKASKTSSDLDTPSDLPQAATDKISAALNVLLADAFALYLKTKNFHWHVSGRHFRDYHLLLDEQSDAIFATTDQLAERVRKIGGTTVRSIGQVSKLQTIKDNNEDYVPPREMLRELMEDNKHVAAAMRKAHKLCDDHEDFRHRRPARDLHRRDRAAHVVPVRSLPPGKQQRGLNRLVRERWPARRCRTRLAGCLAAEIKSRPASRWLASRWPSAPRGCGRFHRRRNQKTRRCVACCAGRDA